MNRDIKFRALKDDMSNCSMVYGQLLYKAGAPRITDNEGRLYSTCLKGTVGQFTGLHDKNGKEIYEGDIIPMDVSTDKWNEHFIRNEAGTINGFVEWNNKQSRYIIKYPESKKHNIISTEFGWGGQIFEVIGNIHENPELLS